MATQYDQFIERMKELGASKPYMSENEYNSFHGIGQEAVIVAAIFAAGKELF